MTIEKSLPNMVMVCVDGVENGDIYGRYFHRYKKEETFFPDSATLVIEMERFYDAIGYPQAENLWNAKAGGFLQKSTWLSFPTVRI